MIPGFFRQHVVEFILGTGIVTDGVVNAASTTGPWTWVAPDPCMGIVMDAVAGGSGGGNGGPATGNTSCGGGVGGYSGATMNHVGMRIAPGESLTVTVGAGGASGGFPGGPTSIIAPGGSTVLCGPRSCLAVYSNISAPQSGSGANGSAGAGGGGTTFNGLGNGQQAILNIGIATVMASSGAYGGAGNASGAVAGANGNPVYGGGSIPVSIGQIIGLLNLAGGGTGNTSGTISYGGGGAGAITPFGIGGVGGNGNAPGAVPASGYGGGGGGGGGNAAGGAGGPGYARIMYWSVT